MRITSSLRSLIRQSLLSAAVLTVSASAGWAFHDGGVGDCDGCHSMHSYAAGVQLPKAGPYLLKGPDSGSTCLICHQQSNDPGPTSYHVSTPDAELISPSYPKQLTPGGDFGWLKMNFSWYAGPGQLLSSNGTRHGHDIAASDYGYFPDTRNAPGGTYPGGSMSCISCHDPHGRYRRNQDGSISTSGRPIKGSGSYSTSLDPDSVGSAGVYRLLGGTGYYTNAVGSGYAFSANPPAAVAPSDYNRAESSAQTRVGYGAGMSEWCRNCHANIHKGADSFTHLVPAALGATYAAYYNAYVKNGDLTGVAANAYWSLAPFEVGTDNYAILKGIVSNTPAKGPDSADGTPAVMCLSCHRAHAGSWDFAMRWNYKTDDVVYSGYYAQEGQAYQPYGQGRTEAQALQGYYQMPATRYNSTEPSATFCYKCHNPIPSP